MDWQETLERAIPQPPPTHPDPASLLADGKRLVRRRRAAAAAGAALAVATVIGIGAVVVPSRDSATPNPPIATQSTGEEEWPPKVDIPLSDLAPVAYDFDTGETTLHKGWTEVDQVGALTSSNSLAIAVTNGTKTIYAYFPDPSEAAFTDASRTTSTSFRAWVDGVSVSQPDIIWEAGRDLSLGRTGWKVVREIPDPLGYDAPWESLGAVIERDGVEQWILLRGSRTSEDVASHGFTGTYAVPGQTVDDWLAQAEEADRKGHWPDRTDFEASMTDVVEFSGSKVVPAEDGVQVLEQLADPDIGHSFATETRQTAAARITVDGEERYVLVQEKLGAAKQEYVSWAYSYTVLPAPRAEDRAPLSLEEFAAMVKGRTPPGGGMWE